MPKAVAITSITTTSDVHFTPKVGVSAHGTDAELVAPELPISDR